MKSYFLGDSDLILLWNKSSEDASPRCWAGERTQLADSNRHTMHLMPVSGGCAFLKQSRAQDTKELK